ncbi:hypothetical protein EUGRSUZ_G00335 [Eucalyptus grandis]|uniref:Uncharacterized protein n=2 Tax=Eucalyptus grandis TaxID=71139 RepID=A0A059B939_EUCGR|nr:hypothetical protein EUGRSUZ_G00335 [Eucalyptus grandis]
MSSKGSNWTKLVMILAWIALTLIAVTFLLPMILMNKGGDMLDGKINLFHVRLLLGGPLWSLFCLSKFSNLHCSSIGKIGHGMLA